jgi:hypothetical protein
MAMAIEGEPVVFEDRQNNDNWRVEYFDDDGCCYVTIFSGPESKRRALACRKALIAGALKPIEGRQGTKWQVADDSNVAIFSGPAAQTRARAYCNALKAAGLTISPALREAP